MQTLNWKSTGEKALKCKVIYSHFNAEKSCGFDYKLAKPAGLVLQLPSFLYLINS
jgi:hypothetical protein